MERGTFVVSILIGALSMAAGSVYAADQAVPQETVKPQKQEQIYGSQLMTKQERIEHRAKMRAAKTAEEREQIRKEQHDLMTARAKERGVTLPDQPPVGGMGPGAGMGPGGGMGPGAGRNR